MSSLLSKCSSCRCHIYPPLTRAVRTQRKKKGVLVRLLQDIPEIGQAGAVMEVPRVQMRGWYFPARQAEYILRPKGGLKKTDLLDPNSMNPSVEVPPLPEQSEDAVTTPLELEVREPSVFEILSPLLRALPTLSFRRRPISPSSPAIFGSVTAANVLAYLAEEHAINIDPSHCTIELIGNTVELGRVKQLGKATCKITFAGTDEVWLALDVVPEDAPAAT